MPGGSKNEIRKMASQMKHEGLGRSDKLDWATEGKFKFYQNKFLLLHSLPFDDWR